MNPFDLPVHPVVVHFPIAALTAAWVCLLGGYVRPHGRWGDRAMLFEGIGVATLPITVLAGLVDTRGFTFVRDTRWDQPLVWHVIVSLSASAAFLGHFFWRRGAPRSTRGGAVVDLVWATAAMWLLVLTGSIAGEMVYAA